MIQLSYQVKIILIALLSFAYTTDIFLKTASFSRYLFKSNGYKLVQNSSSDLMITWQKSPLNGWISFVKITGESFNLLNIGYQILIVKQVPKYGFILLCTNKTFVVVDSNLTTIIKTFEIDTQPLDMKVISDGKKYMVALLFTTHINEYNATNITKAVKIYNLDKSAKFMRYSADYNSLFTYTDTKWIDVYDITRLTFVDFVQTTFTTVDFFIIDVKNKKKGNTTYKGIRATTNQKLYSFTHDPKNISMYDPIQQQSVANLSFKIKSIKRCSNTQYFVILQADSRKLHIFDINGTYLQKIDMQPSWPMGEHILCNEKYLAAIDANGYYYGYTYINNESNPIPNPDDEKKPIDDDKAEQISDGSQSSISVLRILEIILSVLLGAVLSFFFLKYQQMKADKAIKQATYNIMKNQIIAQDGMQANCRRQDIQLVSSNHPNSIQNARKQKEEKPFSVKNTSIKSIQQIQYKAFEAENRVNLRQSPLVQGAQLKNDKLSQQNIDVKRAKYTQKNHSSLELRSGLKKQSQFEQIDTQQQPQHTTNPDNTNQYSKKATNSNKFENDVTKYQQSGEIQ